RSMRRPREGSAEERFHAEIQPDLEGRRQSHALRDLLQGIPTRWPQSPHPGAAAAGAARHLRTRLSDQLRNRLQDKLAEQPPAIQRCILLAGLEELPVRIPGPELLYHSAQRGRGAHQGRGAAAGMGSCAGTLPQPGGDRARSEARQGLLSRCRPQWPAAAAHDLSGDRRGPRRHAAADRPEVQGQPHRALHLPDGQTGSDRLQLRPSRAGPSPVNESTPTLGRISTAGSTAFGILVAISFCHLLNDMMQSLLPALYPMLRSSYRLSFTQIGLLTFT